jgi:hypothetical protein
MYIFYKYVKTCGLPIVLVGIYQRFLPGAISPLGGWWRNTEGRWARFRWRWIFFPFKATYQNLSVIVSCLSISKINSWLWNINYIYQRQCVKKLLIAFPISFFVERGFSAMTDLITKKEIGSTSSKEETYAFISQTLNQT